MLKFKEILQLFCIVLVELPLEIASWLIVPIALLFCDKQSEHLPKWARWFEDASVSDFCKVTLKLKDGRSRFGLYKTIRYKGFLSGFYCRIYIGWKLMDVAEMNEHNKDTFMQPDDKAFLKSVWAVNPFKRVRNER